MKTSMMKISATATLVIIAGTAHAQLQGSALNYMLQRPRVAKQYADKRLLDHLFVDGGAGFNLMGRKHPEMGALGQVYIGDWITPEHALRLGLSGGSFLTAGVKAWYADASLDYLLNITALAQHGSTYTPRCFELYGIGGLDFGASRHHGHNAFGLGVHVGLRGQVALSPFTYFYIEPKLGIVSDDLSQVDTWHGYRPLATAALGFGYRLPESRLKGDKHYPHFLDGWFVGVAGGPAWLATSDVASWGNLMGVRLSGSLGKWLDRYHALRLSANATVFDQPGNNKVKAVGAQLDYLLNLHNAFGGVDPDRVFWLNGVAGVSYNYTTDRMHSHKNVVGFGAGLQANLRLSRELSFTLEPRVDIYGNDYAQHATTFRNKLDIVPSVLAGLTYTYHGRSLTAKPVDTFRSLGWHDHLFVEAGAGANLIVARKPLRHVSDYVLPQVYMGVGKWFSPVNGARLWGQLAKTQWSDRGDRYTHVAVGADYLLNLTNAFYGYRRDRVFDVTGALGANVSRRSQRQKLFLGFDASLRGTWHVSPLLGLFVEPRVMAYSDNYMPTSLYTTGIDMLANLNVGLQFNMDGSGRTVSRGGVADDADWRRGSFTVVGGLTNRVGQLKEWKQYSPVVRIGYTQWFSPYTAWRVNMQGMVTRKNRGSRYAQALVGADLMADLTSYTYGYDASRPLAVRVLAGVNLGADTGGNRTTFAPDVHVGGQLALRLTDALHLVAEPQLAYNLSSRFDNKARQRVMPQFVVGLDYSLRRSSRHSGDLSKMPERPDVVSVSVGTGFNSENFGERSGVKSRLSVTADVRYGHWFDGVNGINVGMSNSVIQRTGKGNESITSAQAGYMMNIKSAVTGESTDDHTFQLTGIAAASLTVASWEEHDTKVAPGLKGALQAGVRVAPNVEIYLEPSATLYGKKIAITPKGHPVEGELKLSLGTKVSF